MKSLNEFSDAGNTECPICGYSFAIETYDSHGVYSTDEGSYMSMTYCPLCGFLEYSYLITDDGEEYEEAEFTPSRFRPTQSEIEESKKIQNILKKLDRESAIIAEEFMESIESFGEKIFESVEDFMQRFIQDIFEDLYR